MSSSGLQEMNGFFFFKPETEFIMCQGKVRKGLCVCAPLPVLFYMWVCVTSDLC